MAKVTLLLLLSSSSSSSNFFTSQLWMGNIHLSWDVVINRIRLGGLTCSLKDSYNWTCAKNYGFLQLYIWLGCKLSVVRLCDSDFGITTVDDIIIGINCAAFCFHIAQIVYFIHQFLVLVLFVGCCFGEIMCIWDRYVYQKVFWILLLFFSFIFTTTIAIEFPPSGSSSYAGTLIRSKIHRYEIF